MVLITFDITIDEEAEREMPLLDAYERDMMLEHTRAQMEKHVQKALGDLFCEEHHQQAQVMISGTYSLETEQLDISYNIDTCCKLFLLKVVAALNNS